jgi:CRISPR-associated protein Cmr1
MFLNGADGQTPELRAPSIKGAMRFWWRALNGHLPLMDIPDKQEKGKIMVKGLKSLETEIFGGSGDTVQRSNVLIQVISEGGQPMYRERDLVPHKPFMKGNAFNEGTSFDVKLTLRKESEFFKKEHLKDLFMLTCYLGGLGKRVRRGMGSVDIVAIDGKKVDRQIDLSHLHGLLSNFNPFYHLSGEKIVFNYSGRSPKYGYITEIQLGKPYNDQAMVLRKISDATHKTKEKHGYAYDPSMGHAFKGRYASPVYTSIVRGSVRPIITTLNLAPVRDANKASLFIQQDFKNQIL